MGPIGRQTLKGALLVPIAVCIHEDVHLKWFPLPTACINNSALALTRSSWAQFCNPSPMPASIHARNWIMLLVIMLSDKSARANVELIFLTRISEMNRREIAAVMQLCSIIHKVNPIWGETSRLHYFIVSAWSLSTLLFQLLIIVPFI